MREDRFKWREGDITITRSAGQPLTAEEEELAAFFRLSPVAVKADPQRFSWRGKIAQLWNATVGRLVPRWQVNRWVEASIAAVPVGDWASELAAGTLDVGTWQDNMRGEIKREYIRQYLLGRGGLEKMTPRDWGSIGGSIADQYRYLDKFADEIAAGNLTEGQIRRRSEMYINSAREAYERGKARAAEEAGQNEVWWKRNAQAESCDDCVAFEEMGWMPVDPWPYVIGRRETTPGQGDTICLTSCKCGLMYRKRRHVAQKGGPGSGHFGHEGRPGHRGGSRPDTGGGRLSSDQRYQWHQAVNMAYYDKMQGVSHGNDLLGAMYDATARDSSADDFKRRFVRPGDAPDLPRPSKEGTDEQRLLYGIASIVKEWGEGTTGVTIGELGRASGLRVRQIEDVYESRYRGNRIFQWEARADLNQLRIGHAWKFDKKRGVVHETEAIASALRAAGYSSPAALWKEMVRLLPDQAGEG